MLSAATLQKIPPLTLGRILLSLPTPLLMLLAFIYSGLFKPGEPDPEMLAFVSKVTKGCSVLEVGCNTGRFTRLLCSCVGKHGQIVACEPDPIAFQISKQYLRHYKNVILLNIGLGAIPHSVQVLNAQGPAEKGASVYAFSKNSCLKIRSNFTTVDQIVADFEIQKLDFLIVDAEGSEVEVVRGAIKTLCSLKPKILVELHPYIRNGVVEQAVEKLNAIGFGGTIFWVDPQTVTWFFKPLP